MYVPTRMFFTRGVGRHSEKLTSFEMALRSAGIAHFNLVRVSSIFPPNCKIVPRSSGIKCLRAGEIVHVVIAEISTDEPNRLMAASVGVAQPRDPEKFGYLSEYHAFGKTDTKAGEYAEDLAAEMFATVMGLEFDADKSWDEKREIWRISEVFLQTRNITQSAIGHKDGLWTTAVAAAVLVP